MDDLDNDLARSIDDHIDDAESLPFRYQNMIDLSSLSVRLALTTTERAIMFDTTAQNVIALIAVAFLWFHFGRSIGIRIGYLRGRKAVREYYESRDKVRV